MSFKEQITRVRAFVLDVDGVFTDGGITPTADGDFLRTYNAKDGYAISYALSRGYKVFILSGGRGETMRRRFEYLRITELHMEVGDKIGVLRDIIDRHSLTPEQLLFMGDDIPDVECMMEVGIRACPADAATEVLEIAHYISEFGGGKGCIRDVIEQTLRAQNEWGKSKAVFPPK